MHFRSWGKRPEIEIVEWMASWSVSINKSIFPPTSMYWIGLKSIYIEYCSYAFFYRSSHVETKDLSRGKNVFPESLGKFTNQRNSQIHSTKMQQDFYLKVPFKVAWFAYLSNQGFSTSARSVSLELYYSDSSSATFTALFRMNAYSVCTFTYDIYYFSLSLSPISLIKLVSNMPWVTHLMYLTKVSFNR